MKINIGDQRALANRIAQRLVNEFDVCPKEDSEPYNMLVPETVITATIAEEIKEFFA
jgi:hypothetical protein